MYHEEPENTMLVFTGTDCGTCPGVVEADAMAAWARERGANPCASRSRTIHDTPSGVPDEKILTDRQAQNTVENGVYTACILISQGITEARI